MAKQYLPYTPGESLNTDFGQNTWMGDALQGVSNMPKYWGTGPDSISGLGAEAIGLGSTRNIGDVIDVAHAPLAEDIPKLQQEGFSQFRKKGQFNPLKGKIGIPQLDDLYNPGMMNEGVFVGVGDDATRTAKMYGKGKMLRGTGLGKTMVDPLTGQVPRSAAQFSRNMWGHLQGKIPSGWANKAFGLPNAAIMKAIKKSPATKFFSRFLPGANVAMGATSAADYAKKGQYVRAGLAGLSMIPGPFGWAGLAGEAAVNVGESIMNKRTGETGGGGGKDEGPSEAQQRFERSGADTNRSFTQTDYGKAYRRGGIASLWQR